MSTERDKFLTEAMGECWHEEFKIINHDDYKISVCKCGKQGIQYTPATGTVNADYFIVVNNFSTWEGFGKLWEWSQRQEWWRAFEYYCDLNRGVFLNTIYINPDIFADKVYKYIKDKERE